MRCFGAVLSESLQGAASCVYLGFTIGTLVEVSLDEPLSEVVIFETIPPSMNESTPKPRQANPKVEGTLSPLQLHSGTPH